MVYKVLCLTLEKVFLGVLGNFIGIYFKASAVVIYHVHYFSPKQVENREDLPQWTPVSTLCSSNFGPLGAIITLYSQMGQRLRCPKMRKMSKPIEHLLIYVKWFDF